jgi:hypothetical protein
VFQKHTSPNQGIPHMSRNRTECFRSTPHLIKESPRMSRNRTECFRSTPHLIKESPACHATELSVSEANTSPNQGIPRMSRNPRVHWRVHNSPPIFHTLSKIKAAHFIHISLKYVLILSTNLRVRFPSGSLF